MKNNSVVVVLIALVLTVHTIYLFAPILDSTPPRIVPEFGWCIRSNELKILVPGPTRGSFGLCMRELSSDGDDVLIPDGIFEELPSMFAMRLEK